MEGAGESKPLPEVTAMTVAKLRGELKERGLDHKGRKAEVPTHVCLLRCLLRCFCAVLCSLESAAMTCARCLLDDRARDFARVRSCVWWACYHMGARTGCACARKALGVCKAYVYYCIIVWRVCALSLSRPHAKG